jgi:predicted NAD-dependent protein-ADP-ribosyltransferase YbiA (DUF1768 family)
MREFAMTEDELKPLNVWSRSDEEVGRWMSNFAHTPFVLDGIEYASMEGFYVSLLTLNESRREKIRRLWGIRAKHEGPKSKPKKTCYQGEWFELGSETHLALIKRALCTKLETHPDIANAFVATIPRRIVHETGYPDAPDAEFSKEVFCRLLTEVREEFATRVSR